MPMKNPKAAAKSVVTKRECARKVGEKANKTRVIRAILSLYLFLMNEKISQPMNTDKSIIGRRDQKIILSGLFPDS